ncbi:FCD domain-containing protein [uncultured Sphingomonas sp.]|uniref:FCD domain-containing protein n=1 Tax=uncultured Sphingomonas sp. TaxID=158754 RepID=UPI0025F91933|nr:FCD domain-containing protein [uncultured Sphingomonas sp.]
MNFALGPTNVKSVTDRVETAIEALIAERDLQPGARLPAERELAAILRASRNSLREALTRLAARGRITVRKGGNIVAHPPAPPVQAWTQATIATPLASVVATDTGFGHDVLEVRHGLEGQAAHYAALRAGPDDLARIGERFEAMAACHGRGDAIADARADAAFHLAIAEASHNAVLRSVMASMFDLLQASISQSLDRLYTVPHTADRLLEQHARLRDAIVAGDADAARRASDDHLAFVARTVRVIDDDAARRERAAAIPSPLTARS